MPHRLRFREPVLLFLLVVFRLAHAPGDWNGYRKRMRDMLFEDKIVFAGTVKYSSMDDGWTSAWPGRTIKYIHDNIFPALAQYPNLVLVHAGTNDMSSLSATSTEGNDPTLAADRLGSLIDSITTALHGVVVLVAIILPMCRAQNVDKLNQASSCISSWAGLLWTCSVAEVMAMR